MITSTIEQFQNYLGHLGSTLERVPLENVELLAKALRLAWCDNCQVFICGNGGSAANAVHLANDFFYGIAKKADVGGLRVHALPSNQSITTCLANDVSYSEIFSEQLKTYAKPGDVLIALSGSGNSPNIVRAIEVANEMELATFAILGYSGGKCLEIVDTAIHIAVDDMQIAEDLQVIVGHMLMQWLMENPPEKRDDNA